MKKALVLGASGGMGYAIVMELAARGIETIAFARNREKMERLFAGVKGVSITAGDVFRLEEIVSAGAGAEVIFHAVNVPYQEWEARQPELMGNVLAAAQKLGARLAVVDNIYAYGRSRGAKMTEDTGKHPHTKKGRIRQELERKALAANQDGVPVLVAHFPDFYGPHAENTLIHYTLQGMMTGKRAYFVGDLSIKREYIYTPDGAKAIVELALRDEAYGQCWNIPGTDVIAGTELVGLMQESLGSAGKVGSVGKGMITLMGLFDKGMREFREMMYLLEEPVVLSGEKYERLIGPLPRTPYRDGIAQTVQFMRQRA